MPSKKLVALVGTGCLVAGLLIGKAVYSPKRAYNIWDFNHDKVTDLVIEQGNGNNIILYGSRFLGDYTVYEKKDGLPEKAYLGPVKE